VQDIWFYALAVVANDFNPRFAKQRWYRYLLPSSEELDIEMITKASKLFIGEHDFSHFSKSDERNRIRRIDDIKIKRTEDFFIIDVYGESFLWHMVRKIMSALQKVGRGEVKINRIKDALCGKSFDFGTAPPEPLFLMDTKYDFSFKRDKKILRKIMVVMNKKWLGCRVREEYFSQLLSLIREQ
jgi:tRNA pseudouridine38-40 synthase